MGQPKTVGHILELSPDEIDASDRLLPIDPVWADALGAMMKEDGQLTPVVVRRLPGRSDYKLIEGGHRHAAAVKFGLKLEARVVGPDALQSRLREASENLQRRTLPPLDRARAIAELVAVQKAVRGLDPEQDGRAASASVRWQEALGAEADDANLTLRIAYGWADEVAELTGTSRPAIYRNLELAKRIPASIAEALRRADHPVFHNAAQLKALAGLEPVEQSKVLSLLLHAQSNIPAAPFDKVTDAIAALSGRSAPAPDAKRLGAFIGTFGRMPLTEKKGALAQLASVLPKGWSLVEGDAKAATTHAEQLRAALDKTFDIVARLAVGEAVEDDELESARATAQTALFASRGDA